MHTRYNYYYTILYYKQCILFIDFTAKYSKHVEMIQILFLIDVTVTLPLLGIYSTHIYV